MEYLYILQQALVWLVSIFWAYQVVVSICSLIKQKEKPIIEDKQNSDPNLMGKLLIKMRKDNGFVIKDSELVKAYEEYKKQYE